MNINEATVHDLLQELGSRLPALVVGMILPKSNNESNTRTFLHGNRATVLGLSHMIVAHAEQALGLRVMAKGDETTGDPDYPDG